MVNTWTIEGPGGLGVEVVPLPIEVEPDRVSFGWHTAGSGIPAHQDRVQRAVDGPAVPERYFGDPCTDSGGMVGWITDPAFELSPVGQCVLAFVSVVPMSGLLSMCRSEAHRRVQRARSDRHAATGTTDEGAAADWLDMWLLWEAALDVDDPDVRRVALQLALTWSGGSADMITAAREVLR